MNEPTSDLRDLVERTSLAQISFVELSARQVPLIESPPDEPAEVTPSYSLTVHTNDDPARFRISIRTSIELPQGFVNVEVAGDYSVQDFDASRLTQALVVEYTNHVGLMALLPYARHAISDLTLRVFGEALLMPVMLRGALEFRADEAADTEVEQARA